MALTAAQIQTKIDNLNTIYDTLSADIADSVGIAGRSAALKRLTEVQQQIEYWEGRLARVDATRPTVVRFGKPA